MNRQLVTEICEQERLSLEHLLFGGPQRTFTSDYYSALETRVLVWADRLINRAAMFARSRHHAFSGGTTAATEGGGGKAVVMHESDLAQAWALIELEDCE